ncbi:MAG: HDOD domain-containing protein [Chromatiaceae bacterium]|jgi:HD-like signal output (HDOD) protein
MTSVFGKLLGRSAKEDITTLAALSALGPYAELGPAELEVAANLVDRIQVKTGLLTSQLPTDRRVFLERGSVQVQTHTDYVLLIKAGTAQARYPIPLKPDIATLYAAEPCAFLTVPLSVETGSTIGNHTPLVRPDLTTEEAEALEALRAYFRKQQCELPSLPDLAIKIGKAIDDTDNANDDIARLIQLDPALTARVISVVNSAAFGGLSKISSIQQATARLGRNKVRSLVYSCLLKSIFKINSGVLKRHMEALWQHSAHVAALCYVLGRETPGIDPEQALLAGLVHDIGAVAIIGGVNQFSVLAQREEVLNYTIDSLRIEVGVLTLNQWRLQDEFEDVVKNAENWFRIGSAIPENSDVVILAQLHALIGSPRQPELPHIDSVPAYAKLANGQLSPHQSLSILEEAEADVREIRGLISNG